MKMLWIKAGPLVPLNTGGRIRTWNILKHLHSWDEVTVLTYSPSYLEASQNGAERYVARLISMQFAAPTKHSFGYQLDYLRRMFSPVPFTVHKTGIPAVRKRVHEILKTEHFDVLLCDFLAATLSLPKEAPCPQVLFAHNVETMIWKRHFEVSRNLGQKLITGIEYWKMRRFENRRPRDFDHILTVSDVDRNFFTRFMSAGRISVLPTGVDLDYFRPTPTPSDTRKLVFSGSMDWMANEDAILYFAKEILPRIVRAVPEATLTVVGRDPTSALRRLAREEPRIELTGTVPDIRSHVAGGAVYVVPLRVGSGTRLKIFEAMAMGKAVVSTRVGAEGLPVKHGDHLLLADQPEDFAAAAVRLLNDEVLRQRLGQAARQLVEAHYGWAAVAKTCHDILEQVARRAGNGDARQA